MTQQLILHPTHPQPRLVRAAAAIIRNGGVVAYPTDSSYALGCSVSEGEPARRIRVLRGVDDRHHLTLVCGDLAQVGVYARMDNWQFRIVRQGTPGSYTFLLPASREVPRRVQHPRRSTIGVRVPDHPVVRALLAELGEAILSSTLILPGASEPLNDAASIDEKLHGRIEGIIDAGPCPAEPTTVIDLAQPAPVLIRQGRGDLARLGLDAATIERAEG
jgi:tRNA threonylcarbamoyl adenosine modification protein (Sua5/YciO/YrdC/YwlC family)